MTAHLEDNFRKNVKRPMSIWIKRPKCPPVSVQDLVAGIKFRESHMWIPYSSYVQYIFLWPVLRILLTPAPLLFRKFFDSVLQHEKVQLVSLYFYLTDVILRPLALITVWTKPSISEKQKRQSISKVSGPHEPHFQDSERIVHPDEIPISWEEVIRKRSKSSEFYWVSHSKPRRISGKTIQ